MDVKSFSTNSYNDFKRFFVTYIFIYRNPSVVSIYLVDINLFLIHFKTGGISKVVFITLLYGLRR